MLLLPSVLHCLTLVMLSFQQLGRDSSVAVLHQKSATRGSYLLAVDKVEEERAEQCPFKPQVQHSGVPKGNGNTTYEKCTCVPESTVQHLPHPSFTAVPEQDQGRADDKDG